MSKSLRRSLLAKYIKQLLLRYREDDLASMSAQVTYFLILAFFPFLFFLLNLLSFTPLPGRLLIANFTFILPNDTAALVKDIMIQTVQAKSKTILFLGMFGGLWAVSQGMLAMIRGLNHSYGVKESRHFVTLYLIAFIATLGLSVMVMLLFFMIVFGRIIGSYFFDLVGAKTLFYSIWSFLRYVIPFILMVVTFYLMYTYLPNKRLHFKHRIVGTLFATFGWISASGTFSYYVNNFSNYQIIYGSLGGMFALILWLYMSALIILLGGELNAISSSFAEDNNPRQ